MIICLVIHRAGGLEVVVELATNDEVVNYRVGGVEVANQT